MKTHNEMARVFIDIWAYYWHPESEYNLNSKYSYMLEHPEWKNMSLISKTEALIEHDRFLQRVEEKSLQNLTTTA